MAVHKTTHLNYNSTADPSIHFHQPAVKIQLCIPAQILAPNSHRPESLFRVTKVRFIAFHPIYRTYKNTQNARENIFCIALSCDLTDFMVNLTKRLLFIKNVLEGYGRSLSHKSHDFYNPSLTPFSLYIQTIQEIISCDSFLHERIGKPTKPNNDHHFLIRPEL